MKGSGDFSIGSQIWPGVAKLQEEMGELNQVFGKLIAVAGDTDHWSGDLRQMMVEELGDVMAAIEFLMQENMIQDTRREIYARAQIKLALFRKWHTEGRGPDNPEPIVVPAGGTSTETVHGTVDRKGKILFLPFVARKRSAEESQELDAATEWLLTELGEPVSLLLLRALASKEISRPRDAIHKRWAMCFLKETEGYTKEVEEREL